MEFKLVGAEQLAAKLKQAGGRAMPIIAGALTEIGEEIMVESKRQAPWLTGALRNSGRVFTGWGGQTRRASGAMGTMTGSAAASIGSFGSASDVTVTLAYGGTAIPYALYQHEGKFNHPKGGKAHYLSDPVKARGARFAAQMAAKLRGRLERALAR